MAYILIWNGEEIDAFEDRQEVRNMAVEYSMAFRGGVTIKNVRSKNGKETSRKTNP